jgi:hypothetical protein
MSFPTPSLQHSPQHNLFHCCNIVCYIIIAMFIAIVVTHNNNMMSFSKFARNFVTIGGGCVGHGSTSKGNQTLWQHGNWEHHEVLVLIKCKHFEHVTQNCWWTLEHTWCQQCKGIQL